MGSLTHLQPGQGYMLYRKAAGNESLQYPTLGGSLINGLRNQPQIALKGGSGQDAGGLTTANRLIAAGHLSAADQLQMPVAGNYRYASNMTVVARSEEHTSELQSLMRISYAVFCLKKKKNTRDHY